MRATVFALLVLVAPFISESSCEDVEVFRGAPRRPIVRHGREAPTGEPLWLYDGDVPRAPATGDHPVLPSHIDDIKLDPNTRHARSLDRLNLFRGRPNRHDGPMIPGPNARYPRDVRLPFDPLPRPQRPFDPLPRPQRPIDPFNPFPRPGPRPLYPIYA